MLPSEVTLRIQLSSQRKREKTDEGIACNYCKAIHPWRDVVAMEGPGEIITFTHKNETGKASPETCTFA